MSKTTTPGVRRLLARLAALLRRLVHRPRPAPLTEEARRMAAWGARDMTRAELEDDYLETLAASRRRVGPRWLDRGRRERRGPK